MSFINNLFTIGDVAKSKNITIDTLRHYDKINLLKPEFIDKKTGYRYYSTKQFFKIDLIKFCKSLGIPLSQIKDLLENSNQENFVTFLENQKNEIDLKIQEYTNMISQINNITNRIDEYNVSKKETGIYYKYLPKRNIVYLNYAGSEAGEDSLFAYSKLHNLITDYNLHISYNGGFIYDLTDNDVSRVCIFECVNESNNLLNIPNNDLPSGTYLCKSYKNNELKEALDIIIKEIHNKEINSHYILNTYLIDGEFHSNNVLSELQVFISDKDLSNI